MSLSVGRAAVPLPTLTRPLSMVLAGQRRQLVVCVVRDLAPSSGHAVWISGGNGSILQSFAYGASQEDGGTVCSVSLLSSDPQRERELACHVGANRTSPSHSSSPIRITGMMTLLPPPLPALASAAQPGGLLLTAVRHGQLGVELTGNILETREGTPKGRREKTQCWLGDVQDGSLGLGGQERGADTFLWLARPRNYLEDGKGPQGTSRGKVSRVPLAGRAPGGLRGTRGAARPRARPVPRGRSAGPPGGGATGAARRRDWLAAAGGDWSRGSRAPPPLAGAAGSPW
uniref:Ig-like domain-containing protein n=1 Tax=Taeniopygia guttata TaxID=59729 RepID=A0A674HQ53_TAEGU